MTNHLLMYFVARYIPILTLQRCVESANEMIEHAGGRDFCNHSHFVRGTGKFYKIQHFFHYSNGY